MRRQSGREATLVRQMGAPFADKAGRPDPGLSWPCGCPPHRRAPRSRRCRHRDADVERTDTDAGHRTSTPGYWTADAWTSRARTLGGHPGHPASDTGHRTFGRNRVRVTGRPRHGRHPDRHPAPTTPYRPMGRRTVDLWTAPAALGNDDGSATVRSLPARDYLRHYPGACSVASIARALDAGATTAGTRVELGHLALPVGPPGSRCPAGAAVSSAWWWTPPPHSRATRTQRREVDFLAR
jgi:hypothetical protein